MCPECKGQVFASKRGPVKVFCGRKCMKKYTNRARRERLRAKEGLKPGQVKLKSKPGPGLKPEMVETRVQVEHPKYPPAKQGEFVIEPITPDPEVQAIIDRMAKVREKRGVALELPYLWANEQRGR